MSFDVDPPPGAGCGLAYATAERTETAKTEVFMVNYKMRTALWDDQQEEEGKRRGLDNERIAVKERGCTRRRRAPQSTAASQLLKREYHIFQA